MKELTVKLNINEANLILEALGNQPYIRVYELIGRIHQQAGEQLSGPAADVGPNGANGHREIKAYAEEAINE